jgi:hypothetical protein
MRSPAARVVFALIGWLGVVTLKVAAVEIVE